MDTSPEVRVEQNELVRAAAASSNDADNEYASTAIQIRDILKWTNLDFLYVFEKPITDNDVVVHLKESLSQLLAHYPTLSGRVLDGETSSRIKLNNEGAAFRVQQQISSVYEIPQNPAIGSPYCYIPVPEQQLQGTAPLLTVTVTKFKDGWTLGVVMNHLIVDGWTFAMFMKDWSTLYNNNDIILEPVQYQLPNVVLDTYPTQQDTDKAATELLGCKRSSWGKRMMLKLVMQRLVPSIMKTQDPRLGTTPNRLKIHYSDAQVQKIKAQATIKAKTVDESAWVSTNEAVMCHVWQILLDAANLTPSQRACIGVSFAINLRNKLPGVSSRLAGNAATSAVVIMDMTDSAVDTMEKRLHYEVRAILTEEKLQVVQRIQNTLWMEGGGFILYENKQVDAVFGGVPGCLDWNWQVMNPYFQVDFGSGPALRGIPWYWEQPVTVLPCARGGGIDVYIDKGTNRGHVKWIATKSKWSTISNILGLVSLVSLLLLQVIWNHFSGGFLGTSRWTSLFWLVGCGMLYMGANYRANQCANASRQEFYEYIQTNAHRSLD